PKSILPGGNAFVTATTNPNLATGNFTITVLGQTGSLTPRITTAALEVAEQDFSIGFSQPQVTLSRGQKGQFVVSINRIGGFSENVTVMPDADMLKVLKIKVVQPSQSTTGSNVRFDFKVKSKAPLGTKQLTFTGRDNLGRIRNGTLILLIQ